MKSVTPIVKYSDINQQLISRQDDSEQFALGTRKFIYGLAKKVIIANTLAVVVDKIFSLQMNYVSGSIAWTGALFYTLQIYYDFSGYSDMAIGLAQLFGFSLHENFNYPYLSTSVSEFWRRWHISLGTWFREYVYIPLGGNQRGMCRTCLNLLIVFMLTGLWHGANWTFIFWGIYYGIFIVLERLFLNRSSNSFRMLKHIYTLLVVVFGWVIFRADSITQGVLLIKRMLMPWKYTETAYSLIELISKKSILLFICAVCGSGILMENKAIEKYLIKLRYGFGELLYCMMLLFLCIISLSVGAYNPFIYFRF